MNGIRGILLAILAATVVHAQARNNLEENQFRLDPGDGDVRLIEENAEDERLDDLVGDPTAGLFDNYVDGVWRNPYATPDSTLRPTGYGANTLYGGATTDPTAPFSPVNSYGDNLLQRYVTPPGRTSIDAQAIPEPGTWAAIVAVAGIGVATARRRRRATVPA